MSTYWPSHQRLGTQVAMVLALPLTLALALTAPQILEAAADHAVNASAESRSTLALAAASLARGLENERDALSLAGGTVTDDVGHRRRMTDDVLGEFRRAAARNTGDPELGGRLEQAEQALSELAKARGADMTTRPGLLPAISAYTSIITSLNALVPTAGRRGSGASWAAYTLAMGASALSAQRALIDSPATPTALSNEERAFLSEQDGLRRFMLGEFRASAGTLAMPASDIAVNESCLAGPVAETRSGKRPGQAEWATCSSQVLDRMHDVEADLLERGLDSASAARAQARNHLIGHIALIAVALLLSVGLAALATRRLVRRLHRLRRSALRMRNELPAFVERMSRAREPQGITFVTTPIDVGAQDEVGDVARAFDAVVKEAVSQISKQVALRTAAHGKLASMSRRGTALVHRQLELLSSLQMSEQNPATLEFLFQLDHLAIRMRRHGETMLFLAGEDPGRTHQEDAPVVDVLRAAAAEVEDYTRAVVQPDAPAVFLKAEAVHGVTHLLAELVENATKFSPVDHPVRLSVEAASTGDAVIRVGDTGRGIPEEQLNALNVSLQNELPVDWVQSECTGLHAVSCLAGLHGTRVYIDSTEQGTTVVVVLSADLLVTESAEPHQE
ncbi:sensor histidine kinase [Streptomyces sp. NPDC055709]